VSKLIVAIGLVAALVLSNPPRILDQLGPDAQLAGYKLKRAFNVGSYLPTFSRIRL
jgi:hypothetical protein